MLSILIKILITFAVILFMVGVFSIYSLHDNFKENSFLGKLLWLSSWYAFIASVIGFAACAVGLIYGIWHLF